MGKVIGLDVRMKGCGRKQLKMTTYNVALLKNVSCIQSETKEHTCKYFMNALQVNQYSSRLVTDGLASLDFY